MLSQNAVTLFICYTIIILNSAQHVSAFENRKLNTKDTWKSKSFLLFVLTFNKLLLTKPILPTHSGYFSLH